MALLLNRKYGSRLECLYFILKFCYKKFGVNKGFTLKDIKFDEDDPYNVHSYCQQLKEKFGRKYCPYLENPLNPSKCYATQSLTSDSTKSKAVSDVGSSLEALGFMKRINKGIYITDKGGQWCETEIGTKEWESLVLEGTLTYGGTIGFLYKANQIDGDVFNYTETYLGYPQTEEMVTWEDERGKELINLSTNSKKDSNTRTRTKIVSWALSGGLVEPVVKETAGTYDLAHINYRDIVNAKDLRIKNFKKTPLFYRTVNEKRFVSNPLSYTHLHKNVESLRERGSERLRKATLHFKPRILNRRFVLVFILNRFSKKNESLNLPELVKVMNDYKEYFFIKGNDALQIMQSESDIAFITGIPFAIEDENLTPLTEIDEDVLISDAPAEIIKIANEIWEKLRR